MFDYYASLGFEDSFRRMLVLDALIINIDRHAGNHGIIFDTETYLPIKMAPVFDNNIALLPYALEDNFGKNIMKYLAEKPTKIGADFNAVAHYFLTSEIKSDLKNLRGFKFERNTEYSLPDERLNKLEELINMQIYNILNDVRIFVKNPQ